MHPQIPTPERAPSGGNVQEWAFLLVRDPESGETKCQRDDTRSDGPGISLGHGFTQGDVPEQGTRVLVITDNAKTRGDALAKELGAEIREKRGTWYPEYLSYDDAITAALFAGRLAHGSGAREVAIAALAALRPVGSPRASDLLLDGLARLIVDDPTSSSTHTKA